MRPIEIERIIAASINRLLSALGYVRRELQWYRYSGRWIVSIEFQLSGELVVVRMARFDRQLVRESHPELAAASEITGMTQLVDDVDAWTKARTHALWESSEDAEAMFEYVRRFALPRLLALAVD